MLADRKGWATFIGTPKGKNEFWKIYNDAKKDPAWFHMMLKASESGIIAPGELTDLRREMGEDQYQQEFECSFEAAIKGAFYAEEMRAMLAEGRICRSRSTRMSGRTPHGTLASVIPQPSGSFSVSIASAGWSITTNPQVSVSITMRKCFTTSASSMDGNTETTIFRMTSNIEN